MVALLNDEMLHAVQGLCQILLLFAGCLTLSPMSHVIDGKQDPMHLPLDGKENNELPFKISKTYLHL